MAGIQNSFQWKNLPQFDRVLAEYRKLSKRDPATITNTKGYYIMRRATVETDKSTKAQIRSDLMELGRAGAPIAALIVNARRAKDGLRGLQGAEMRQAVAVLIKARKVASLAAGWIPGIKALQPLADKRGAPRIDRRAKQIGPPRGYAIPATDGLKAKTTFVNTMEAAWDKRDGAETHATPGLEKGFEFEQRSMLEYMERKYRETAQKAGIKTN